MNPSRFFTLLFLLLCGIATVRAHPVAQGSMEVNVLPDHITVRTRVSNEQVFVAGTFGKNSAAPAGDLWALHGPYLLDHLRLEADGRPLEGKVLHVSVPDDKTTGGYASYELRYETPSTDTPLRELRLRQDLLNEIEFAPGNMWEATLVLRQSQEGKVVREGLLFTHKEPIVLACNRAGDSSPVLDRAALAGSYFHHGMNHILEGWDHLLFMAGLVL
ncbi:MAG: hypothetical protein V4710_10645 [Verrucomicrobiota bacterium]